VRRLGKAPRSRSRSKANSDANKIVDSEYHSDGPIGDARQKRREAEAEGVRELDHKILMKIGQI
jgi:hypothetical protein